MAPPDPYLFDPVVIHKVADIKIIIDEDLGPILAANLMDIVYLPIIGLAHCDIISEAWDRTRVLIEMIGTAPSQRINSALAEELDIRFQPVSPVPDEPWHRLSHDTPIYLTIIVGIKGDIDEGDDWHVIDILKPAIRRAVSLGLAFFWLTQVVTAGDAIIYAAAKRLRTFTSSISAENLTV